MVGASRLFLSILGILAIIGLLLGAGQLVPAHANGERLVLAFYYTWFDKKTWSSGTVPDVPATPYNSDDHKTMARQIDQAKSAGIDAFILNWWGKGNRTEKNLKALLNIAGDKGFRVAVDFDINSPVMNSVGSYADSLRHLHSVHAAHPAYLRYQGRPVVFFYNVARHPVATWQSLRDQVDPDRNAIWIAEGVDLKYQSVFDGHHLYSVTWPNHIPPSETLPKWGNRVRKYNRNNDAAKLWVATVMPGYDDRRIRPGSGFVRSRDGGDYYRQCWQAAIDSRPSWVVINSFNEWPEGSYIEPSKTYGRQYLDLTREWVAQFKGSEMMVSAAAPPPSQPTPVPPTPTPKPTSLPTPRPSAYVLEDPRALSGGFQASVRCGYDSVATDTVCLWPIYDWSGAAAGDMHPLCD
jgi:hypothetical protein